MTTRYCSVCSSSFDLDEEGCEGNIGLIPFAFCATCRVGIWEWAQISFDLVPRPDNDSRIPIRKDERNRKVYHAREAGFLFKDIAKKFGVSLGRVASIYRREKKLVMAEESRKRMGLKIGD
jgi:hypothetical protein